MDSVSGLLYMAAGSPIIPGDIVGQCRTCGQSGTGLSFGRWAKDSFTNHDLLQPGSIVCHACLFTFSDQSESVQQRTGKEKIQKFRNYSHFVLAGKWFPLTKGEKRKMRELLAQAPEVVIIADSGQKHLAFRARVGWWQFEEFSFLPCWGKVEPLLAPMEELINGGFSKREIESGDYNLYRIEKFGLNRWRELSRPLLPIREAIHFQLALFLAQKNES